MSSIDQTPTTGLEITAVDRTVVRLPYREVPKPHMNRWLPHWRYAEIIEVTVKEGSVGVGETMLYYTWGSTTEEAVDRVIGRNAAAHLWNDELGAGLQMALFDVVGKVLGVPSRVLMGTPSRSRVPLSWWAMDMPGSDWLSECQTAIDHGYTEIKLKGRPWFDVRAIVERLSSELPDWFGIDIDFNETLLDAERALPILRELESYPQVQTFESPIPQEDVAGNVELTRKLEADIAIHYGRPPSPIALREPVCDGFVLNQGAEATIQQGAAVAAAERPLWLQLVGSGVTTAFTLQLGSVLDSASWPTITCYQLYTDTLVTSEFEISDGRVTVPESPGLGIELDRDRVDQLSVDPPSSQPEPDCLIKTELSDGTTRYFSHGYQMQQYATSGEFPFYEHGVSTEVIPIDNNERERLHEQTLDEPVVIESS